MENATIREARYRSATSPGKNVFIAQVKSSDPVVPNFRAAMKITFRMSGNLERAPGCRRSTANVSMPSDARLARSGFSEKRATAMMFLRMPAFSAARWALRARLGPIFPPAPKISKSPSSCVMAAMSASDGRDRISSSSGTDFISVFVGMLNLVQIPQWHKPFHRLWVGCCPKPYVPAVFAVQISILSPVVQRSCLPATNPKTNRIQANPAKFVLSQDERLSVFVQRTGLNTESVFRRARNSRLPVWCTVNPGTQESGEASNDPLRKLPDPSPRNIETNLEMTTSAFRFADLASFRHGTSAQRFAPS